MAKVEYDSGEAQHHQAAHVVNNAGERVKTYRRREYGKNFKDMAQDHADRLNEEVEELQELSRQKLFKYMNKARPDEYAHDKAATGYERMDAKGMKYAKKAAEAHGRKAVNRYYGIGRAGSKLQGGTEYIDHHGNGHRARVAAHEEVQLDEISKSTLARYIPRAHNDSASAAADVAVLMQKQLTKGLTPQEHKEKRDASNRDTKRTIGISKAVQKLTKEETGRTLKSIVEDLKRSRGRPKKKRDMQGNTVDDDQV